jgi:hypothetical protein
MKLNIMQDDTNCIDYLAEIRDFIKQQGIKTQEQLEQSFDSLVTRFAMLGGHSYNVETKTLTIKRLGGT